MKGTIALNATNDDPHLVSFYGVVDKGIDLLRATIEEALKIPQGGRENITLQRWTAYLGTLCEETSIAAAQLVVLDLPRAAAMLNRQVFEYSIRLRYLYAHPDNALALLDSSPWRVHKEAERAPGFFEEELRDSYRANYRSWAEKNPTLDSDTSEGRLTDMAREVLGQRFDREFFPYYALPSIVAHGKPHGIVDVLSTDDGGVTMSQEWDSKHFGALDELSKLAYFLVEIIRAIRERYSLGLVPVRDLNDMHGAAQDSLTRDT